MSEKLVEQNGVDGRNEKKTIKLLRMTTVSTNAVSRIRMRRLSHACLPPIDCRISLSVPCLAPHTQRGQQPRPAYGWRPAWRASAGYWSFTVQKTGVINYYPNFRIRSQYPNPGTQRKSSDDILPTWGTSERDIWPGMNDASVGEGFSGSCPTLD